MSIIGKLTRPLKGWLSAAEPASSSVPALDQIILPAARQRWMYAQVNSYTPDLIESTIRGAMAGDLQAVWRLYDLMEATWPRLSKNLKELKDAVASADWTVQPWTQRGKPPTPESTQRAELLDAAIWTMAASPARDESTFRGLLFDLLDAWGKGISVAEILWQQTDLAGFGSVITPRAAVHVWPLYYGYPADRNELMLNAASVRLDNPAANSDTAQWSPFTPDKFLIAIAKQKSGHPAGSALLRPLAWWWCASNFSATWFLNFAQIFGIPIRWANYDPNTPGLVDKVCDMLDNLGSSGWAAFPTGTTLELKEPARGGAGTLPQEAVIDRADRNCDILVLGQTLTTDVADSGSRALGDVHQDVLGGRKRAAADWLAGVLTAQLSPAFCRLNWGNADNCPQFVVGSEAAEDPLVMAQRDEILLRSGVSLPQEWFYTRHDIPIPGDNEPVINKPAPVSPFPSLSSPDDPTVNARSSTLHAKDAATERLVDNVLEDLTGVEARWLGGVKPWFRALVIAAQDNTITDAEFLDVLAKAQRELPELFGQLNHEAVSDALEKAMGAAVVNGAVRGYMTRRTR